MSRWLGALAAAVVLAIGAGLLLLYLEHRDEGAREAEREDPIVAPSRVRVEDDGPAVAIDTAEARRIGLETAVLAAASAATPKRLPGQVVEEPERVAVLRAPLSGRLTVGDGQAWPALGERIAAGTEVGQVSDARPLVVPLGGVVARVEARPGAIVAAGQTLLEVVDRSRPVARIVWEADLGEPARTVVLAPPGERRVPARLLGPAAEADPLTRRPAYLYRADRGWPGAAPGTPVAALVPSGAPAVEGVLVPDDAVVQWDGLTWAYRARGGAFQRVPVSTERPVPGGWVATRVLAAGDTVVVAGAQELLSEEFRSRITVGDEAGE